MSALIGFLSGVGDAGVKLGQQHMKFLDDEDLQNQRAEIETQKEERLLAFKQKQAEAPLLRIQGKAQEFAGQQVPQEAAPVKELTGAGVSLPDGQPLIGLKGDPDALRKQANAMPDGPDKTAILAQIDKQLETDTAANRSAVEGKTRARTSQESLDAAVEWARTNDLPAVAAYEAAIGKPARDEKRVAVAEQRATTADTREANRDKREEQRLAQYDKKIDNDEAYRQRREERMDKLADLQEQRQTSRDDKAETQSQRTSVTALMTSTERELERTMTLAKDPMLDDATKKMFDSRVESLTKDLGRYKRTLESFAGESLSAPATEAPKARNGWDSTTGEVYKNGEVVGKAKSEQEARGVYAGQKPAPAQSSALIGTTSGSHAPTPQDTSGERAIRAQIADKRSRLQQQGISEQTKLQLNLDLRELEDKLNQKPTLPSFAR